MKKLITSTTAPVELIAAAMDYGFSIDHNNIIYADSEMEGQDLPSLEWTIKDIKSKCVMLNKISDEVKAYISHECKMKIVIVEDQGFSGIYYSLINN
jgi:hypothetical protein